MIDFRKIKEEMHLTVSVCEFCGGLGTVDWLEKKQEWGLTCNQCGMEIEDD